MDSMALLLALLLSAGLAPAEEPAQVRSVPWKTSEYTLIAREMPLRDALTAFGTAQGLSVVISRGVAGVISGDFRKVPPQQFLEEVTMLNNLAWYYDGAAIYIYASGEIETLLIDLKYMKAGEVRTMLRQLGVEDERFPLKTTSNDELVMVAGPPRYVMLIAELVEKADKLREKRTFSEVETRIFKLKYTWADDVSIGGGDSDGSIKGVASILKELMQTDSSNKGIESVQNKGEGEQTPEKGQEDTLTGILDRSYSPIIQAENRLNAVIVRDAVSKMPLYEKLIAELDVPQKLVEIAVTSLELSKNDALDWQLSLAVKGTNSNGDLTGAAGQNPANLFSPEALLGKGIAGAMSYIGKHVTVSASLNALRQKGKARSISRTSILTVNNMSASIKDMQSYHARVIGTEVASLEEVSVGTTLNIKPRIVFADKPDQENQLWITVTLSDGGFEAMSVDSMPLTRSSTVTTQTSVHEGDCILLAGYLRDIEEKAGWGIPYLRDIPYIGWVFGGVGKKKETVQRMFILTPYIIDLNEESLARLQASRQRDITREEELEDDKKEDDAIREMRQLERQDRDEDRRLKNDLMLEKRRDELELKRKRREAEFAEQRESWRKERKIRREQWERSQKEQEKARRRAEAERKAAAKRLAEEERKAIRKADE